MTSLGFDNYAEACKVYLAKYRSRQLNQEPSTLSYRTSLALTTSHRASPASATDQTRISAAQTQTGGSSPDSDSDDPHPGAHTTKTTTNGNNAKGKGKKRAASAAAQPLNGGINSSTVVRAEEEDELSEDGEDDSAAAGGGGKRRKLVQPAQYQLPHPGAGQAPPSSRS